MGLRTIQNKNIKATAEYPAWLENYTSGYSYDDLLGKRGTTELYNSVSLFRACLKIRCDSLSSIPYVLTDGAGEEKQWEDLFPESSLQSLLWKTEATYLLSGRAFWEIIKNTHGVIRGLQFVNPYALSIDYANGRISFKPTNTGEVLVNDLNKKQYQVVYFREFNPIDDIQPGKGDAEVAGISGMLMREVVRYPQSYLEGGAAPVTLLGVEEAAPSEIQRVENWVKRAFRNSSSFVDRILGIRAKSIVPQTLSPTIESLKLDGIAKLAWDDIQTAFGVPESMLRSSAANYATAREERKSFYEDKLEARANIFAAAMNEQLLEPLGYNIYFDVSGMMMFQDDEKERMDKVMLFRESGVPLVMALDLSGIELTDEQRNELELYVDETPVITTESKKSALPDDELSMELGRWERMACKRIESNKELRTFESDIIPLTLRAAIEGYLEQAKNVNDIKQAFLLAKEWSNYP